MTKHRPVVEPGTAPESPERRDVLRELSELADELQRAGMARGAKTARRAIKLIRATAWPSQSFVDQATTTRTNDDPTVIGSDLDRSAP